MTTKFQLLSAYLLAVSALAACGANPRATPVEPAASSSSATTPTNARVFVEAALFDTPTDRVARLAEPSIAALAASHDWTAFSSPHALFDNGKEMVVTSNDAPEPSESRSDTTPSAPAPNAFERALAHYRLTLRPRVLDDNRIELNVVLDFRDGRHAPAVTTVLVPSDQLVVMGTLVEEHGRHLVLVLRPNVVRSDEDLRRLLDDKMKQRREGRGDLAPRPAM